MVRVMMHAAASLLLGAVLTVGPVHAQTKKSDDAGLGKIGLSVVVPDQADGLSASQLSKLRTRIQRVATSNGVSGSGLNNTFVMYPKFEIFDEMVVEGMKNITVVQCEVSLFVKQMDNNVLFATYTKSLKGSGYNRQKAINDAIGKIPSRDPKIAAFMNEAKDKIVAYYNANCDKIIQSAANYTAQKDHRMAIITLLQIPEEVTECNDKAREKRNTAYKAYANQRCKELMQSARAADANRDFKKALAYLGQIDPTTSCAGESRALIKSISSRVDAENKREWDLLEKAYDDSVELEKQRYKAMSEIAKAYVSSTPQVTYQTVVK